MLMGTFGDQVLNTPPQRLSEAVQAPGLSQPRWDGGRFQMLAPVQDPFQRRQ